MKTLRSLPETDLARVALLPGDDSKRIALEGVRSFRPRHSLSPLRKVAPALYAARPSLLALPKVTFPEIEAAIRQLCGTNLHWQEPNLSLARLLFEYNQQRDIKAVEWDFGVIPRGGPGFRDRMAAWLRWILGLITPPISAAPGR